jgi:DNA-binding NarL/FixJ family response regulator
MLPDKTTSMKKIIVDIADDHQMIIGGLKEMMAGIDIIQLGCTYNSGIALLNGLQKTQPDVLLLDIQMQDVNGDELAALITKTYPSVRILVVTGFDTVEYATLMLGKGATGYLLKNTDEYKLKQAIEAVYKGKQYIEASIQKKLEEAERENSLTEKPILSKREKDILRLLLEEYTNQQIADKLFISLRTVEFHRMALIVKLNAKNAIGMAKRAIQLGLVK